jgi:glycosyltransferase involved in cell wall biosynthesis
MHVGLLIYGDINTQSGGYLYDRKLVAGLQQQGDTVELISLPHRAYVHQLCSQADLDSLIRPGLDVMIQDELVHPSVCRINRLLKQRTDIPLVGLVHLFSAFARQPVYRGWLHRRAEQRYIRSVDGLILNSRNTLHQACELVGEVNLPAHVVAVPAGDNFTVNGHSSDPTAIGPLRLLYAGNVIRQKGLHILLQALAHLPRTDYTLTVAGRLDMEPGYVNAIRRQIRQLQLGSQVTLTGPLHSAQLAATYQAHQLFVLPSVNEAYGIVYVEAQQFGLPVIGTTAGGAAEIIRSGYNGYLIQPDDSAALARLLASVHADRKTLEILGKNARAAYLQHPTWEDTCRTIRAFLIELISRKGDLH